MQLFSNLFTYKSYISGIHWIFRFNWQKFMIFCPWEYITILYPSGSITYLTPSINMTIRTIVESESPQIKGGSCSRIFKKYQKCYIFWKYHNVCSQINVTSSKGMYLTIILNHYGIWSSVKASETSYPVCGHSRPWLCCQSQKW